MSFVVYMYTFLLPPYLRVELLIYRIYIDLALEILTNNFLKHLYTNLHSSQYCINEQFLHTIVIFVTFYHFYYSYSGGCAVVSHVTDTYMLLYARTTFRNTHSTSIIALVRKLEFDGQGCREDYFSLYIFCYCLKFFTTHLC